LRPRSRSRMSGELAPLLDSSQFDDLHDEVALRRSGKRPR
jgi:hypothetical protein